MNYDPTRTALLRRSFAAEISRRMKRLKAALNDFLITQDALGLVLKSSGFANSLPLLNIRPKEFSFRTEAEKLKAFREWLDEQVKAGVLSLVDEGAPGASWSGPWTGKYIKPAYERGVNNAYLAANKLKLVMDEKGFLSGQSDHLRQLMRGNIATKQVQLLATRSFEELRGVTNEMAGKMNRILAQGFVEGKSAKQIAKQMASEVDGITRKRAKVIANTEIIRSYSEGSLDSFQQLGIDKLHVQSEWTTAGDDRVCERCSANEGKIFKIEDARGLIPLHTNCRCAWLPYIAPSRKRK